MMISQNLQTVDSLSKRVAECLKQQFRSFLMKVLVEIFFSQKVPFIKRHPLFLWNSSSACPHFSNTYSMACKTSPNHLPLPCIRLLLTPFASQRKLLWTWTRQVHDTAYLGESKPLSQLQYKITESMPTVRRL